MHRWRHSVMWEHHSEAHHRLRRLLGSHDVTPSDVRELMNWREKHRLVMNTLPSLFTRLPLLQTLSPLHYQPHPMTRIIHHQLRGSPGMTCWGHVFGGGRNDTPVTPAIRNPGSTQYLPVTVARSNIMYHILHHPSIIAYHTIMWLQSAHRHILAFVTVDVFGCFMTSSLL